MHPVMRRCLKNWTIYWPYSCPDFWFYFLNAKTNLAKSGHMWPPSLFEFLVICNSFFRFQVGEYILSEKSESESCILFAIYGLYDPVKLEHMASRVDSQFYKISPVASILAKYWHFPLVHLVGTKAISHLFPDHFSPINGKT
jgi:hypothetical protein